MSEGPFGFSAAALAGAAAQLLGWRPDEFWNATPAELATALGLQQAAQEAIDLTEVASLIERFPDD